MDSAVDLWGLARMTADEQQLALVALALDQDVELATDQRLQLSLADGSLHLHQLARALLDQLRRYELLERSAVRAFLVRVAEGADVVQLDRLHELEQRCEVLLGLTGMADDERASHEQ